MRLAFVNALSELAAQDSRIVLLTADLGYLVLEQFGERFPDRFFNAGVAEQNMVGLAVGLADAGYIPFVYSIAPFACLRPFEFIRNGALAQHLPVRVVGIGGGFDYSTNGISHYALEDVGLMRTQPGMTVIVPADSNQAAAALRASWELPGPVYYRVGKNDQQLIEELNGRFAMDCIEILRNGPNALILTMGSIASEALVAANELAAHGVNATVAVVACLNPAPQAALARLLANFTAVATLEAHYINGGLGSLVCEIATEHRLHCHLARCGVTQVPDGITGSLAWMYDRNGISGAAVANRVRAMLNEADKCQA